VCVVYVMCVLCMYIVCWLCVFEFALFVVHCFALLCIVILVDLLLLIECLLIVFILTDKVVKAAGDLTNSTVIEVGAGIVCVWILCVDCCCRS
jgi:hypothetical protein